LYLVVLRGKKMEFGDWLIHSWLFRPTLKPDLLSAAIPINELNVEAATTPGKA
jgi:hypothetical protein